jgi:hypothetical protein
MKTTPRRRLAAGLATLACAASFGLVDTAQAQSRGSRDVASDPAVIDRWSALANRTVVVEGGVRPPGSTLYTAFVSLAMYDAVVAVEGGFEPFADQPRAAKGSSPEAAAATAAYEVLRHYFPASAGALAADYRAELSDVDEGRSGGVAAGRAAAETIIDMREDDGRDAAVTLPTSKDPGKWEPVAPVTAMYQPWLGKVDPLLIGSADRFDLDGPPALKSRRYAKDFDEAKKYGAKDGSARSAEQTATATFWTVNPVAQLQRALGDLANREDLDIAETARAFALLDAATADALIVAWAEKLDSWFWRPETAIPRAGEDDNRRTTADPAWKPLRPAPPYPEYPSGHGTIVGAATETFDELFKRPAVTVPSLTEGVAARHYTSMDDLDEETMNARIWLGFHFRTAMKDANALGHDVADWAEDRHFEPTHHRRGHGDD